MKYVAQNTAEALLDPIVIGVLLLPYYESKILNLLASINNAYIQLAVLFIVTVLVYFKFNIDDIKDTDNILEVVTAILTVAGFLFILKAIGLMTLPSLGLSAIVSYITSSTIALFMGSIIALIKTQIGR
jgi:hypothetical protein